MKTAAIGIGYVAPFAVIALIPSSFTPVFLAAYVTILLGSMAFPLTRREAHAEAMSNTYKGLMGAVVGLLGLTLYFQFVFSLFREDALWTYAASWVFFSLIIPTASILSVSHLGSKLGKVGLEGLTRQGNQHFALEYCTLHWFRHAKYFVFSIVSVAMYLYGWALLGLPFLVFSIPLLVFLGLLLRTLSRRLLAPFAPQDVLARIESGIP